MLKLSQVSQRFTRNCVDYAEVSDESDSWEDLNDEYKSKAKKRKKTNNVEGQSSSSSENVEDKDNGKKKAKQRVIRNLVKVTVGKKAADKTKRRNQLKEETEEETVLDYEEEYEEEDIAVSEQTAKKQEELKTWKLGGWKTDKRIERFIPGPHLNDQSADLFEDDSIIDYLFMFMLIEYIKDVMLPATNDYAKANGWDENPFTFDDFINFLGLMYMMEVVRLPERRMYWSTEPDVIFLV